MKNIDMYIARTEDRIIELKEYIKEPRNHNRLSVDTLANNYVMLEYLKVCKAGMIH